MGERRPFAPSPTPSAPGDDAARDPRSAAEASDRGARRKRLAWFAGALAVSAALLLYLMLPWVGLAALFGKPGYLKPMIVAILLQPTSPLVSTADAHLYPPTMAVLIDGAAWLPVVSDRLTGVSWAIALGVFAVGCAAVIWKLGRMPDVR